jgi:alkylresorcinol/alkylpyrone synthase
VFIQGIGTAVPGTRYTQAQCYDALGRSPQFRRLASRSRALLRRLLTSDNGIATRALALDTLTDVFDARPDVLHRRFAAHAPKLAHEAARRALTDAGVAADAIDGVIVSTCTGYLCPGLTSYVIESLGLAHDAAALDLVGQGCGAALPNLSTAGALLASRRCDRVLSICVEVSSAAFYIDDDQGEGVSACVVLDSAGGAVIVS